MNDNVRSAMSVLEDALKAQQAARVIWLVARVAHPAVLDVMAAERYAEASNAAANAQDAYDSAVSEAQAEYFASDMRVQEAS